MSLCILFVLLGGGAYVTPDCHIDGVYVTPHDVVVISHIPASHANTVWLSPQDYADYYAPFGRHVGSSTYSYSHNYYRHYPVWRTYPRHAPRYRRHHRPSRWGFWHPHRHKRQARPRNYYQKRNHHSKKYKSYKSIKYRKHSKRHSTKRHSPKRHSPKRRKFKKR